MNDFRNNPRLFTPFKPTLFAAILLLSLSSSVFGASADLSWDANTETDLAGYKIYIGTTSGSYGSPTPVGNTTNYTAGGLLNGTYFFAVTAIDTSGNESGFSNEVKKVISTSMTAEPSGASGTGPSDISPNTSLPATDVVEGGGESFGGAGGCGMILPDDKNPVVPEDSASMITLVGIILLLLFKKTFKSTSSEVFAKNKSIRV